MCAQYEITETQRRIVSQFDLGSFPETFTPKARARPTERLVVVRRAPGAANEGVLLRWGLVPPFAKDLSFGTQYAINARGETVDSKPSFRNAFRERRCIVPAKAYFEGSKKKGGVWRVSLKGEALFGMAGLWERWTSPGGEIVETYTIITTEANELVGRYSDKPEGEKRMPVILHPQDYAFWLDPANQDVAALKALLVPYPAERMEVAPATLH